MGYRTYISCIYVLLLASIFVLLVTMTSCRATKFVGEGEYLLVKNKVVAEVFQFVVSDIADNDTTAMLGIVYVKILKDDFPLSKKDTGLG